jgi:hypothetical protein
MSVQLLAETSAKFNLSPSVGNSVGIVIRVAIRNAIPSAISRLIDINSKRPLCPSKFWRHVSAATCKRDGKSAVPSNVLSRSQRSFSAFQIPECSKESRRADCVRSSVSPVYRYAIRKEHRHDYSTTDQVQFISSPSHSCSRIDELSAIGLSSKRLSAWIPIRSVSHIGDRSATISSSVSPGNQRLFVLFGIAQGPKE